MKNDLRKLLTTGERNSLVTYIERYAGDGGEKIAIEVSLDELLKEWAKQKDKFLSKIFDDKLVIEKEIRYDASPAEIYKELEDIIYARDEDGNRNKVYAFYDRVFSELCYINYATSTSEEIKLVDGFRSLLSLRTLSNGIYQGNTFEYKSKRTGKVVKVQHGCKAVKTIGKLVKEMEIDDSGFEEFRLAHSRCLNQKSLKGTLCISIHPLDYITMSDNSYGWSSCMSWRDNGDYRRGTVEMMNSPMVIVAYLKGGEKLDENNVDWNSKKWRQLFIVNEDLISGIKAYPYQNDFLTEQSLNFIREVIAEKVGVDNYTKNFVWDYEEQENCDFLRELGVNIEIDTDVMYNDIRYSDNILSCLNKNSVKKSKLFEFNISGLSECMISGRLSSDRDDFDGYASSLFMIPESYCRCGCCGDATPGEEGHWCDDVFYCEYCYRDECPEGDNNDWE